MKWAEVIRLLKRAGYVEARVGKGAHRKLVHPDTGRVVWVSFHGHDAGKLGERILRDAGVK